MELATGRAGKPHITSQQDRQKHQGIWGDGAYILNTGNMLEPVVQSSNKILIKDGALMYQGALFTVKVGTTDEITIDNGNQGMQRKDLVVARYTYDSAQNIESASWLVYKGTAVGSNPVLPSGISGDIQAGDNVVDVPYLAVTLNGINIVSVDVLPEVAPDIPTLNASLADSFFEPGDEISLSGLTLDGYVTQAGTRLLMSIPVGKRLDKITGARTSLATGVVRQNGNYIVGSASDSHGFAQDQGTFLLMKDLGIIRYQYDFSGAPSGISNNDVMSIHFTAGTIQLL